MKLKACTQILALFVYLLTLPGFCFQTHFCGGEITDIHFFEQAQVADACGCSEDGSASCCADLVIKIQTQNETLRTQSIEITKVVKGYSILFFYAPHFLGLDNLVQPKPENFPKAPPNSPNSLQSMLQVYRI